MPTFTFNTFSLGSLETIGGIEAADDARPSALAHKAVGHYEPHMVQQFFNATRVTPTSGKSFHKGPNAIGSDRKVLSQHMVKAFVHFFNTQVAGKIQPGDTVVWNLIGFSRGALNIRRALHILRTEHPEIYEQLSHANLVSLDPVAGHTQKREVDISIIDAKCRLAVNIYAKNETRITFKPQDATRTKVANIDTECIYLIFPGVHSAMAFGTLFEDPTIGDSGRIIMPLCYQVLTSCGVEMHPDEISLTSKGRYGGKKVRVSAPLTEMLTPDGTPDEQLMLAEYAKLTRSRDIEAYERDAEAQHSRAQAGFTKPYSRRVKGSGKHSSDVKAYYTKDQKYFINTHHRELFKKNYPVVFNFYFEKNTGNHEASTVDDELARMKAQNEIMHEVLFGGDRPKLKMPQAHTPHRSLGSMWQEPCRLLQVIDPEFAASHTETIPLYDQIITDLRNVVLSSHRWNLGGNTDVEDINALFRMMNRFAMQSSSEATANFRVRQEASRYLNSYRKHNDTISVAVEMCTVLIRHGAATPAVYACLRQLQEKGPPELLQHLIDTEAQAMTEGKPSIIEQAKQYKTEQAKCLLVQAQAVSGRDCKLRRAKRSLPGDAAPSATAKSESARRKKPG